MTRETLTPRTPEPSTWVAPEVLHKFACQVMESLAQPAEHAAIAADVLVDANLRGIDSHGVEKLPLYEQVLTAGSVNPAAEPEVVKVGTATTAIDAHGGLGFVATTRATDVAAELGSSAGVGVVGVRNSGHFGAASHYALRLAEAGLVGFVCTNTRPLMPAPGGTEPVVGNNPFAFAAPTRDGAPFVIDMACSVAALGKVRQAARTGVPMPANWAYGSDGKPTGDPAEALLDGGRLAPAGGHKGFGLALMLEVLAGVLTGAAFGVSAGSMGEPGTSGCGHFVLAADPNGFLDGGFEERLAEWLTYLRSRDQIADAGQMRIPGERGPRVREERTQKGVPLPAGVRGELQGLAGRLGIGSPSGDWL